MASDCHSTGGGLVGNGMVGAPREDRCLVGGTPGPGPPWDGFCPVNVVPLLRRGLPWPAAHTSVLFPRELGLCVVGGGRVKHIKSPTPQPGERPCFRMSGVEAQLWCRVVFATVGLNTAPPPWLNGNPLGVGWCGVGGPILPNLFLVFFSRWPML